MIQNGFLFRIILVSCIVGVLGLSFIGNTIAYANGGTANLDNDVSNGDLETYCEDETLAPGQVQATDEDGDGDFESLVIGVGSHGKILGLSDIDGDEIDLEIAVSDPTNPVGEILSHDADGDGDLEVLWVGTKGSDLDGDGTIEPEENGAVVAFLDIDGDDDFEVLVTDFTKELGEFQLEGFGINSDRADSHEILWIGILNDTLSGRAGAIEDISDIDGDGDHEILIKDIRTNPGGAPNFGLSIDVDNDGDADIIIQ